MRRAFLIALAVSLTSGAHAATQCTDLVPDASGQIVVHAPIPDFTPLCYAFSGRSGHQAAISISTADQMGFGVATVLPNGQTSVLVDNRQSYTLAMDTQTYRVLVASAAPHGNTAHEFTLTIAQK